MPKNPLWKTVLAELDADLTPNPDSRLSPAVSRAPPPPSAASPLMMSTSTSVARAGSGSPRIPTSTPRTDAASYHHLASSSHLAGDTPRTNLSFFDAREVERKDNLRYAHDVELTMEPLNSARTAASSTTVTPRLVKTTSGVVSPHQHRRSVDVDALGHLQGDIELYGSAGPSEATFVPYARPSVAVQVVTESQ